MSARCIEWTRTQAVPDRRCLPAFRWFEWTALLAALPAWRFDNCKAYKSSHRGVLVSAHARSLTFTNRGLARYKRTLVYRSIPSTSWHKVCDGRECFACDMHPEDTTGKLLAEYLDCLLSDSSLCMCAGTPANCCRCAPRSLATCF